jgi:glycine cleavage system H protein
MDVRQDRMYTREHEWVRLDGNTAYIGITDHAQEALGAIVYVELPPEGKELEAGDSLAVLESVKAASSVYTPFAGEVVFVNRALEDKPELLNEAPYEHHIAGVFPVDALMLAGLMDAEIYEAHVASES